MRQRPGHCSGVRVCTIATFQNQAKPWKRLRICLEGGRVERMFFEDFAKFDMRNYL